MSEHTKEPWIALHWNDDSVTIHNSDNDKIATLSEFWPIDDARRIVACVNACAGIDLGDLENGIPFKQRLLLLRSDIEAAEAELELMTLDRDACYAALERVRSITVEEIHGLLFRNKTDESDDDCWIEGKEFHKLSAIIHRLLTERMEGK